MAEQLCGTADPRIAVIPDGEGNDSDTYTYSGSLKANGAIVTGYAESDDDWQTITFIEE